jgi:hypothetical protein
MNTDAPAPAYGKQNSRSQPPRVRGLLTTHRSPAEVQSKALMSAVFFTDDLYNESAAAHR